jgi:hypothetical protein
MLEPTVSRAFPRAGKISPAFLAFAAAAISAWSVTSASADDYTKRANKAFADVAEDRRTDLKLLPVLAKLSPAPKELSDRAAAAMLIPGKAGWDAAAKWSQMPEQQEALKVLAKAAEQKDWKKANIFAQPYGIDGVSIEMIQAGLYTDLGDPPTLAGAKIQYIRVLDQLFSLCNIEATRLTYDGKVNDAIDLMINMLCLSRQMCDRSLFVEISWGMNHMRQCFERIRDVVYIDSRGPNKLDNAKLKEQIKTLDDKSNMYFDLSRIRFPDGDRAAAEQLTSRVYGPGPGVDPQIFSSTMARLTSTVRPLRLFTESGKWRSIGSTQAPRDLAMKQVDAIFSDWASRWTMPWFDKRTSNVIQYTKLDRNQFAALAATIHDMGSLIPLRHTIHVECIGTRQALAVQAFKHANSNFPPQLTAVRPAWIPEIEPDPYYPPAALNNAKLPMEYYVPIRDTEAFDGKGNPHDVDVVSDESRFHVKLKDDVFVLYSIGSDNAKNNASRVQNTEKEVQGADYLIWPPVISLVRQNLIDRGDLK